MTGGEPLRESFLCANEGQRLDVNNRTAIVIAVNSTARFEPP
jgi:hypothetical protein